MNPFAMPDRIKQLPRDPTGRPFLFFMQGKQLADCSVVRPKAVESALRHNLCYICGGQMGRNKAFILGPNSAIARTAIEPPSHRSCALYAAKVCPHFVTTSVVCVWVTQRFVSLPTDGAAQLRVGEPIEVLWLRHGMIATQPEVVRALNKGIRVMIDVTQEESDYAVAALLESVERMRQYLPREGEQDGQFPKMDASNKGEPRKNSAEGN